jgi:hypothetical protein
MMQPVNYTISWQGVGQTSKGAIFWTFGWLLDEQHKPSMSRMMLFAWTVAGLVMIRHELLLKAGQPALQNAVWTAWWAAEGVLCLAVFGPRVASYFGAGAAGSMSGIAAAVRDQILPYLKDTDKGDKP